MQAVKVLTHLFAILLLGALSLATDAPFGNHFYSAEPLFSVTAVLTSLTFPPKDVLINRRRPDLACDRNVGHDFTRSTTPVSCKRVSFSCSSPLPSVCADDKHSLAAPGTINGCFASSPLHSFAAPAVAKSPFCASSMHSFVSSTLACPCWFRSYFAAVITSQPGRILAARGPPGVRALLYGAPPGVPGSF